MGRIRGTVSLSNPTRPDLAPLQVSALADSGAVHLCIPEHLAIQLSLAKLERYHPRHPRQALQPLQRPQ